jgi:endonuclease/exonuclease/phosphatase family metal-dependent hydrolase
MRPHVVLCQEMTAPWPARLKGHVRRTANALGMEPVLGPPVPWTASRLRTAVLVDRSSGIVITDEGPPPPGPADESAWCMAVLEVPGLGAPLGVFSVHMPARSAAAQLTETQILTSLIAAQHPLAVAGGDWNSYPRSQLAAGGLAALPAQLRCQPRWRRGPGGVPEPDYAVHDALRDAGLTDIAAHLPPGHRDPPELTATAAAGRIDRFYVSPGLAGAATRYRQQETAGSDHAIVLLTLSIAQAAAARRAAGASPAGTS